MDKKKNNLSLLFGVPGLLGQIIGRIMLTQVSDDPNTAPTGQEIMMALGGLGIALLGTALLVVGLAFYARAKGRHWAWCFMGFLSIIGLIVLACLKDQHKEQAPE